MADIDKFKVRLCELQDSIWRDIEITSVSSVAKLGYAILAAFESTASHLFNIRCNGKRYEIMFEEDGFDDEPVIDPIRTKISALKLVGIACVIIFSFLLLLYQNVFNYYIP